ncbi:MAG: hypothetical protein H6923_06665 [Alphaproteobacteria bacterium]|nr:hypothetical protein [Alphaproteobacteria bacterium]
MDRLAVSPARAALGACAGLALLALGACAGAPEPQAGLAESAPMPPAALAVPAEPPAGRTDPADVAIVPVEGARPNIHVGIENDEAVAASKTLALALMDAARETELTRALQRAAVDGFLARGDCDLVRVRLDLDFTFAGGAVADLPAPAWVMPATLQGCGRMEQGYLAVHVPEDGAIRALPLESKALGSQAATFEFHWQKNGEPVQ